MLRRVIGTKKGDVGNLVAIIITIVAIIIIGAIVIYSVLHKTLF